MLLLMVVVVVMVELFLEAEYPKCSYIKRDAVSCCPASPAALAPGLPLEPQQLHAARHHSLCPSGSEENLAFATGCDDHKWTEVHAVRPYATHPSLPHPIIATP